MASVRKSAKWAAGMLRAAGARAGSKGRVEVAKGKPLYLGKGARLSVSEGATCRIGSGVYLSPGCVVEVLPGASLSLGDGVYMNDGCRVVAAESIEVGPDTIFGPDVKVYDHDHVFDKGGVHAELVTSPVSIGGGVLALRRRCRHARRAGGGPVPGLRRRRGHARLRGAGRALRRRAGAAAEEVQNG